MVEPVKIRESVHNDKESIRKLHINAFGAPEGETISQLAIDLLEDQSALPMLSLVAETNGEIVGNVIFTSVNIEGKGPTALVHIMAPLAVASEFQGKGIGTTLIKAGLHELKERGTAIVLVLGDPGYYSRTGFNANHDIKPPYELEYPEAWMAQELIEGTLQKIKGTAQCAISLNSPELW